MRKEKAMQQEQNYPILEFDTTSEAIIEPKRLFKPIDIPEHAVACFFQDVITLEVLEELEQKPEQSQAEFMDDLKTLEQLCRANLDTSKEY
jgi:hypothetical protein